MKVLITTDLYTTNTNGVVTSVRNLMEELEKKGHEVRVLTVSEKLRSHKEDNIMCPLSSRQAKKQKEYVK